MVSVPISDFKPESDRLAVIRECMENYDVGAPDSEWPNNIISRRAVVYGSGLVARQGDQVSHSIDPGELTLCRRLAAEAAALMSGVQVGMGSESSDTFGDFYIAANLTEPVASAIDEFLIRAKFGGTLFPPATITIEPLDERGIWWGGSTTGRMLRRRGLFRSMEENDSMVPRTT